MSRLRLIECVHCGFITSRYPGAKLCWDCAKAHQKLQGRAIMLVQRAVTMGKIPPAKTLQCVDCNAPAMGYDHRDYSKPLDVAPVCIPCNWKRGPAKRAE